MDSSLGYDETPYPCAPYPYSHCEHLRVVASLFGVDAADVRHCRVLEVGCADGGNLIPMAWGLPESQFLGIDLSPRQIAVGRARIEELGLNNVALIEQDLVAFADDGPSFDYIIAHGVLSWTSPTVQGRLLDLIRARLSPAGVAFVSYNVYPGWAQTKALREWLLHATRHAPSTTARLAQARRLMQRLRQGGLAGVNQAATLVQTLEQLVGWSDGYLRHDLLEETNEPSYFAEFAGRLERHGLRFVAEADVASMAGTGLDPNLVAQAVRAGGTLVGREQLLDLFTQRTFRQSLICRADCPAREQIDERRIESKYVVSMLRGKTQAGDSAQAGNSAQAGDSATRFEARNGFRVDVSDPRVAAALERLATAWPRGVWFEDLAQTAAMSSPNRDEHAEVTVRETLANLLLAGFVERCVELHCVEPRYVTRLSDRPQACPLARLYARQGPLVPNLRHDVVVLESTARELLALLDGTRTRVQLSQLLEGVGESFGGAAWLHETLESLLKNYLLVA